MCGDAIYGRLPTLFGFVKILLRKRRVTFVGALFLAMMHKSLLWLPNLVIYFLTRTS